MNRVVPILDLLIEAGIAALLLFAPLPLGSVHGWSQALVEGLAYLLFGATVTRMLVVDEVGRRPMPLLRPGLAMLALVGLQLVRPMGTMSPYVTWQGFRLGVAYLCFVVVLSLHLVTRERITRLLALLAAGGSVFAAAGLVALVTGHKVLPWMPTGSSEGRLVSTFVNPNHQALYFGIVTFLTLGLLLRSARRGTTRGPIASARSANRLASRVLLSGAVAFLMVALVLTQSRGGLVSAAVGFLVVMGLMVGGGRGRRAVLSLVLAAAAVFGFVSWVGMDRISDRLAALVADPIADWRWPIWRATVQLIGDAPFLGTGLGSYQDAFARYRPIAIPHDRMVEFAHNDYAQLAAETGLLGLAIALWAVVAVTLFSFRRWMERRDPELRGIGVGAFGAFAVVLGHSLVDFGLHLPANALLALFVGALLPAAATVRGQSAALAAPVSGAWSQARPWRVVGAAAVAVGTVVACLALVPHVVAGWALAHTRAWVDGRHANEGTVILSDLVETRQKLSRAAQLEPQNPEVQFVRAMTNEALFVHVGSSGIAPDGKRLTDDSRGARVRAIEPFVRDAMAAYESAVQVRPYSGYLRDRFGWFLARMEGLRITEGAEALRVMGGESFVPRAWDQLQIAIRVDPHNAERHRSLAVFALSYLDDPAGRRVAAESFRRALTMEPTLIDRVLDDFARARAEAGLMIEAIPRTPNALLRLAEFLDRRGDRAAARRTFEMAVAEPGDDHALAQTRLAYARVLLQWGEPRPALDEARRALVLSPRHPEVFELLGGAYEALGHLSEADEAWASAVGAAEAQGEDVRRRYRAGQASFLARRGFVDRAVTAWRRVLRDGPNDAWAHLELGRLLEKRAERPAALTELRAAQLLGSGDVELQRAVARAFTDQGHLREAATAYETALRIRPEWNDLRVELAELYRRIGRPTEALVQYRSVLARDPGHATAQQALTESAGGAVQR